MCVSMQDASPPVCAWMTCLHTDFVADLTHSVGGMKKVENTDGVMARLIHKALQPDSSIRDRAHPFR